MARQDVDFKERVSRNLEISKCLQQEPWRAFELDRDPEVLSAVMAHHADLVLGRGTLGSLLQPSATRQALRGLIDAELAKRAARSQFWLSCAGFAVSLAGFALAAVQLWVTFG